MVNATATAPCDAAKEAAINGTMESLQGVYAQIKGYKYATKPGTDAGCYHQDLEKLKEAVELGPVSVCVVAQMWSYYTGGVMTAATWLMRPPSPSSRRELQRSTEPPCWSVLRVHS